jgi:S1-C subfamily serine protease/dienelactone hydrolase
MFQSAKYLLPALVALVMSAAPVRAAEETLEELREKAIKAAMKKIAPCVVMIETSGGTEIISSGPRGTPVRKGVGPTSGLIVSADGYIVSSAFNFANKPSSIIVAVPGKPKRAVAKVIATDQTRMLTLLKIDEWTDLPLPTAVPKADIKNGQTALAIGRTLSPDIESSPSVSEGIVSAVERIWGKMLQTDAKISPTNYGGPLVDLTGRVQGVLVPASPRDEGETAGVGWYDSGIGFAIPLEDIQATLPRLKQGKDLKRGLLGVTMQSKDEYSVVPTIGTVNPGSAAEKAGLKVGDVIQAVDGKDVRNHAQLMHKLGSKYEGDTVTVKIKRGMEEMTIKVVLGGAVAAFVQPFLGILPIRDDPGPGVEVRYVYPKSPADQAQPAGIKAGDRITKVGRGGPAPAPMPPMPPVPAMQPVRNRDHLLSLIDTAQPGTELKFEVTRKEGGKTEVVTVKLGEMPDEVPAKLPEKSTAKKALEKPAAPKGPPMPPKDKDKDKEEPKKEEEKKDEPKKDEPKKDEPKKEEPKKVETGLLKRTTAAADHTYYLYIPENYDANVSHALVVWLHPVNKKKEQDIKDFADAWSEYCQDQHLILCIPLAENETGWAAGENDFINEAVKAATDGYTIDRRRVVAHGMGIGGQMAFYMGFHDRGLIRAVATTGAAHAGNPKEKVANQPLSFFLVAGGKDPLKDSIKATKDKLTEYRYSAIYREIPNMGHQYLTLETLEELVRWIDSLDRL